MEKLEQIYEGKAKKVFRTDDPNLCIVDAKSKSGLRESIRRTAIAIFPDISCNNPRAERQRRMD